MTGVVAIGEAQAPGTNLGLSYLIAAGLLTGVFQILWGYLRLAYQMRFVPTAVLSGFVNALALLIFQAQLPQMGINFHYGEEIAKGHNSQVLPVGIQIPIVWLLIIIGLIIIYGLPKITRLIPSQLVAILIITIISITFSLDIPTVKDLSLIHI